MDFGSKGLRVLFLGACVAATIAVTPPAEATSVPLTVGVGVNTLGSPYSAEYFPQGAWTAFLFAAPGSDWYTTNSNSPVSFSFTLTAPETLNVTDTALPGDVFNVFVNGTEYTTTATATSSASCFNNLSQCLSDAWIDSLSITLGPGSYVVTGDESLFSSQTTGGVGALELVPAASIPSAPIPATWLLMLAGLVGFGFLAYRRPKERVATV